MILTALCALAEREGLLADPDYEPAQIAHLVNVGKGGVFKGFTTLKEKGTAKQKKKVKMYSVPMRSSRTGQDWPEFLVDKGEYVFGWNESDLNPKKQTKLIDRAVKRNKLFIDLLREAYEHISQDAALGGVLAMLENNRDGKVTIPQPENYASGDVFGFMYEDDPDSLVSDRPVVKQYWSSIRFMRVQVIKPEDAVIAQCAASGVIGPVVRLHPAIKGVPPLIDTKGGVPLSSTTPDAFKSYDMGDISCVPISPRIADGYGKALERLLAPAYPNPVDGTPMPKRNFRLSDDTAVVYWSKEESEFLDFFSDAVEKADPSAVQALYDSTWKGKHVSLDNPTAFYALTLSGAQGRATIRGWFESTVRDVAANVRLHFDDLKIVCPPKHTGYFPLKYLLRATAAKSKRGDDPDKNVHPNLASAMFEAVIKGYSYPRIVLDAAIRRNRAEQDVIPDRAALIKAYLSRARRLNKLPKTFQEVMPMLDTECTSTAYRLGRLFATLEKLQQEATNATTTIRNRYYGAASATPVVVFAQLLRKVPHHIPKTDRPVFFEKLIQEIVLPLKPLQKAFPSSLNLEDQGLFALGYYHQRQDLWTSKKNETNTNDEGEQK